MRSGAGTLWSSEHPDKGLVLSLGLVAGDLFGKAAVRLGEGLAAAARRDIGIASRENLFPLSVSSGNVDRAVYLLDNGWRLDRSEPVKLNQRRDAPWTVPAPAGLRSAAAIQNGPHEPNRILHAGVDFAIRDGLILLKENPLAVFDVQGTETLWLRGAEFDKKDVWRRLGYIYGRERSSSSHYLNLLNAAADGFTGGTSSADVQSAVASALGIALATEDSVVEAVLRRGDRVQVVTDREVLTYPGTCTPRNVGDAVPQFGCGVKEFELVRSDDDLPADLTKLVIPAGFTPVGVGSLAGENKVKPVTKSGNSWRFPLTGHNVNKFWQIADQNGAKPSETEIVRGEVNPAKLLWRHVAGSVELLRINARLIEKTDEAGDKLLRDLHDPHRAMIVHIEPDGKRLFDTVSVCSSRRGLFDQILPASLTDPEVPVEIRFE